MPKAVASQPGRPRGNVTLRMRDEVRDALQREAAAHGRSLSEEIEVRLERSLLDRQFAVEAFDLVYGPRLNDVLMMLGRVMRRVAGWRPMFLLYKENIDWLDCPWKFDQMVKATNFFLERLRPEGEIKPPGPPERVNIYIPNGLFGPEPPTPEQKANFQENALAVAEFEALRMPNLWNEIASREIERIIAPTGDDLGPALRDKRIAARLGGVK